MLLAAVVTLFVPQHVAADDADIAAAKELFRNADKHYSLGEYQEALDAYTEAYRLSARPGMLFNIGQCHRKLGQHKLAIDAYTSYLLKDKKAKRTVVESLIAESRTKLAQEAQALRDKAERERLEQEQRERERADREKAELEAAERARTQQVQLEREKAAHEHAEREIAEKAKAERERIEQEARLKLMAQTRTVHPWRRTATWGMAGSGLVVVAGATFALLTRRHQSAFDDARCGDPEAQVSAVQLEVCRDHLDGGRRYATLSNIFLGVGTVTLAGSALLFFLDPGKHERSLGQLQLRTATLHVSPTGIGASWRF